MPIDNVNDLSPRVQYVATAAQTAFDYPFPIFADADLVVDVDGVTKALTTHYTVSGEGEDAGGTVTFLTAMTGGEIVTIYRDIAIARTTDFQQHGPYSSASFNDELDRITLILQQLENQVGRSLRLPMTAAVANGDIELAPLSSWLNKYVTINASGEPEPAALVSGTLTQAIIGALIYAQTAAESSAGVTPSTIYPTLPYDVRRAGIVPNSAAARAANTAALQALLSADEAGPVGWIVFPNVTGTTTYYFDMDDVPIRAGVGLDLQGCTLDVGGSYAAANDTHGFFEAIQDVVIENGTINIDYDGSSGTNNGNGIRLGSRIGYGFGTTYSAGVEDEDLTVAMGNLVLRNLRITSNNASGAPILMLGGLDKVLFENVDIDGDATARKGVYYEFGFWHYEATVANRKSSHATNMHFKNVSVRNLATASTGTPVAFSLVGAMSASIDGLNVDGGYTGVTTRCGEALYYNMGTPNVDQRAHITMRNVVITATVSTPFTFTGSESKSGGYLSGEAGVTEAKQCDLISLSLDGFSIEGTMVLSGRSVALRNGVQRNGGASGGILLQDELMWFEIDNVRILDNAGIGLRFQTSTNIFSVARFKSGVVRNCFIAGSTGVGTNPGNSIGVLFDTCRFGYESAHDGQTESTQTAGISNSSTATHTTARNCYGGGLASGSMYTNAGSGGWKYAKIESPAGDKTLSGQWTIDGHGMDADIGDAAAMLDVGVDLPTQRWLTPLGADRAVTLGTSTARAGDRFRIIRAASATGAFNLNVGTGPLKALGIGEWCEVDYNGSAWFLTAYGSL